jgi:hypothetical protein
VNWAVVAALGGVALGMETSAAVGGEPRVLSDPELATITAAGVLVDVSSVAAALGDLGIAVTDANTRVYGGEQMDVGIGITIGQAFACCGENTDVEVGSSAVGVGDIVHGVAHGVEHEGRLFAYGLSMGFVVALSFDEYPVDPDQHRAMLEELHAALVGFPLDLPDAAVGSAISSEALARMVGAQ